MIIDILMWVFAIIVIGAGLSASLMLDAGLKELDRTEKERKDGEVRREKWKNLKKINRG